MILHSQSLLKSAACPFRYKQLRTRHELGKGKGPAIELVTRTGTALHAFARAYLIHCGEAGLQTDLEAAPKIAADVLAAGGLDDGERADFEALTDGFVRMQLAPIDALSMEFERPRESPDGKWVGTPDLVVRWPEIVEITDWKTWRRVRTATEIEGDIQLPFYAMIIAALNTVLPAVRLRQVHLRQATEHVWILTREQIEAFQARMERRLGQLEAMTEFPAKPGTVCDWCECCDACPAAKAGEVNVIRNANQAVEAAGRLYAMNRARAQLIEQLKHWIDGKGPVQIEGERLDYQRQERLEFDTARVVAGFIDAGITVEAVLPYLGITATGIKRAAKKLSIEPKQIDGLLALGRVKVGTRFGFTGDEE